MATKIIVEEMSIGGSSNKVVISVAQNVAAGAANLTGLQDTPSSYSGSRNFYLRVNSSGTGVEFTNDIDTRVDNEITNRSNADTALQQNIDSEEQARITVDAGLQSQLGGLQGVPAPIVYVPFTDSLGIQKGYGIPDQVDISAAQDGSLLVNLPTKSARFIRPSTKYQVTNSGEFVALANNVPDITNKGIGVFGSYVNRFLWSEDFSKPNWTKVGLTAVPDVTGYGLIATDTGGYLRHPVIIDTFEPGDRFSVTFVLKSGATSLVSIKSYYAVGHTGGQSATLDLTDGSVVTGGNNYKSIKVTPLIDGWNYVEIMLEAAISETRSIIQIQPGLSDSSYEGDGITPDIYIRAAQWTRTATPVPYITSTSTESVSSQEAVSIPLRSNIPYPKAGFTIMVEASIPIDQLDGSVILRTGPSDSFGLCIRRVVGNNMQFYVSDGQGTSNSTLVVGVSSDTHKFFATCSPQGELQLLVSNGRVSTKTPPNIAVLNLDYELYIGSNMGSNQFINGYIKNLAVFDRVLTREQIRALGGPPA